MSQLLSLNKQKKIMKLLEDWESVLKQGRLNAVKKAEKRRVLQKRIHRTSGPPIVYDRLSFQQQIKIQKTLSTLMPSYKKLINSTLSIDNYKWKISDYIDLYFQHYKIVTIKLWETLC
jgi:hypothetical protein